MKKHIITIIAACSITLSAFAPPNLPPAKLREAPAPEVVKEAPAPEVFGPDEWVVELSANYGVPQPAGIRKVLETSPKGGDFGASIGVQKFLTRNLGVGLEAGVNDVNEIEDLDYANVLAAFRTPLVDLLPSFDLTRNLAPYIVVGGGHDFHRGRQYIFAGGGVEYRITATIGAFVESRILVTERHERGDALGTRLGLRIALTP